MIALVIILVGIFVTAWIIIVYCAEDHLWIFSPDYYAKNKVLKEIPQLRKEIAELKAMMNDTGFSGGDQNDRN